MSDLHVKYRPQKIEDLFGQKEVAAALAAYQKKKNWPHAFLFIGHSGSGKTTCARIVARELGCLPANIVEIDAASNNGIDNVRDLTKNLSYRGFGENPIKMIILDEAHRMSGNAFDALLKTLEEPPAHVYFALCTTEPEKIPKTVQTRCVSLTYKPLSSDDLFELLASVCDKEGFDTPDEILDVVATESNGSPRQALTNLAKVHACKSVDDACSLLELPDQSKDAIELARLLVSGKGLSWETSMKLLSSIESTPESLRLLIVNYTSKVLMNQKGGDNTIRLLNILDAFSKPCHTSEKMAPIQLAIASVLFVKD